MKFYKKYFADIVQAESMLLSFEFIMIYSNIETFCNIN